MTISPSFVLLLAILSWGASICKFDQYFDKDFCPYKKHCEKPTATGSCNTNLKLLFYSELKWRDASSLSCDDKDPRQFLLDKVPINTYVQWIACGDRIGFCELTFEDVNSPYQKPVKLSDTYTLTCEPGYDLEGKTDTWYYLEFGACLFKNLAAMDELGGAPKLWGREYTTARCRKQRDCDDPNQYYDSACDKPLLCEKPFVGFHCRGGYNLQYESDASWEEVDSIQCINNKPARLIIQSESTDIVPNHIRCMKEKLCDLQYFIIKNECDDKLVCMEPEQLVNQNLKCGNDFGLQAKFDDKWEDVKSASCVSNSFQVIDKKGATIGSEKYAIAFRCVQMKISKFFVKTGCELQDCKEPKGCDEMKCEDQWGLLIYKNGKWNEVESASCNAGTFRGKFINNGEEFDDPSIEVKCARHKCTQCQNPCLTCTGNEYINAKKWNTCTKFSCGPNARTILGSESYDKEVKLTCRKMESGLTAMWKEDSELDWDITTEEDVKCENSCTQINPLKTYCAPNDKSCEEALLLIKPDNENTPACRRKTKTLFFDDGIAGPLRISNLKCNKANGAWVAKDENGKEVVVPKNSNVHCHYGCNYDHYYEEECSDDNNICESKDHFKTHPGICTDHHGLQVKFGSRSLSEWIDIQSIYCDKNRFKAKTDKVIDDFPYRIRCTRKNLPELYDHSECEKEKAMCTLPIDCAPIKCDDVMSVLHIRSNSAWIEDVDSARCDSDKVTYSKKGDTAVIVAVDPKVKCARMKCTLCENPCPTCKPEAVFSKSTKWNECAKFECGEHTRTTFLSGSPTTIAREDAKLECVEHSIWKVVGEDVTGEEVMCEKLCTLSNKLDNTCEPKDLHCFEVELDNDNPLSCGKKLFFADDSSQMIQISELSCDKEEGVWMTKIDGKSEKIVLKGGSKLYCHFGCDISKYFDDNSCADKSECKLPKLPPNDPCENDFGLQAKFDDAIPGEWIDISKITCVNHHFEVFDHDDKRIDKFPHDFRCIRKKIDDYFNYADCEDGKDCKKPTSCSSITCDDQWALQISKSEAAQIEWEVVDSIRCDSDHFKNANLKDAKKDVAKIRCVRHKCTQCANPCETCLTNFPTAKFTTSTKWDECSTFTCGEKARMIIEGYATSSFPAVTLECNSIVNPKTTWNVAGKIVEADNVQCENSCELQNPLKIECTANDYCDKLWAPNDDGLSPCKMKMFYNSVQSGLVPILNINCNKVNGNWEMTMVESGNMEIVPKDSTVSCRAGCDISFFIKPCTEENDCKEPIKSADERYSCDEDFGLQVDFGIEQTPSGWQDVSHVICEKYRLKVYNKDNSEISAHPKGIRCIRKNLTHLFKNCNPQKENCRIPTNCTNLECEKQWALQVEFDSNKLVEVEWATCNSHEFTIKEVNQDPSRKLQPTGIRCIRLKCTYCTNPCPDCHTNSTAKFIESTKWNDCAQFTCGSDADLMLHENSEPEKLENASLTCTNKEDTKQFWSANGQDFGLVNHVTCERKLEKVDQRMSAGMTPIYVALVTLLLIIIIILFITLVLRLKGYDWLHTIILEHIRDKKRKNRGPKTPVTPTSAPQSDQPVAAKTKKRSPSPMSSGGPVTSEELTPSPMNSDPNANLK